MVVPDSSTSQLLKGSLVIKKKGKKNYAIIEHSETESFINTITTERIKRYDDDVEATFTLHNEQDDDEDIFTVQCPDFPNTTTHVFDVQDDSDTNSMVHDLKMALRNGRLPPDAIITQFLASQLRNINVLNKHAWDHPLSLQLLGHNIRTYTSRRKYQYLLGKSTTANDKGHYDVRDLLFILPSNSLLDQLNPPLTNQFGVMKDNIELFSELMETLKLQNLWSIMIDGIQLMSGITVSRNTGYIYGESQKVYTISDVDDDAMFQHLLHLADNQLAKKAVVCLLVHGTGEPAQILGFTCTFSESTDVISNLVTAGIECCNEYGINVALLAADGGNIAALKLLKSQIMIPLKDGSRINIPAVVCACHLVKSDKCNMKLKHILIPVHEKSILQNRTLKPKMIIKSRHEGINYLLVTGQYSTTSFQLQLRAKHRVYYHGIYSTKNQNMMNHFDEKIEGGHKFIGSSSLQIGLLNPYSSFDEFEVICDSEITLTIVGYTTHIVGLDTVVYTYQQSESVRRVLQPTDILTTDKQSESHMSAVCSDAYLQVLSIEYPQFIGLIRLITLMNNTYQRCVKNKDILEYSHCLTRDYSDLLQWSKIYGVLDSSKFNFPAATLESYELNSESVAALIKILNDRSIIEFNLHLFMTNMLEGLFGDLRAVLRRFTVYTFLIVLSKVNQQRVLKYHPESLQRRNSIGTAKHYANRDVQHTRTATGTVIAAAKKKKYLKKQASYTQEQFGKAKLIEKQQLKLKTKESRDYMISSFAQEAINFMKLRTKSVTVDSALINATEIVDKEPVTTEYTGELSTGVVYSALWKRPNSIVTRLAADYVYCDFEWNGKSQIISVCFYHPRSSTVFSSLVRQSSAGLVKVHGLTNHMLKNSPMPMHVCSEIRAFFTMINAEKIALAAYYDIQFVIKHIIEKEGIDPDSLSLSSIHSHYFGKDMYQQHDAHADTIATHDVVLTGCKNNKIDISTTRKHFDLLVTTQPQSDSELTVEEYTLKLIEKRGEPLKSTGKRKKRKPSTVSGKRKRSGDSQQQKAQKTSSRASKKPSERNADGIDTVNIVSNRRQRSAIASYSQLHNGDYGSDTESESEPDYDGEYESDDYDDEEQSHRDYCMKCHKHGELFMCEGEDCANVCCPTCAGFTARPSSDAPVPLDWPDDYYCPHCEEKEDYNEFDDSIRQ